jgi:hypothetical protein
MGKKRSNAKKTQVTKKNKISSAYGVSVQKGGTITRNNGVIDTNSLADINVQKNHQKGVTTVNANITNTVHDSAKQINGKHRGTEREDFHRLQESLQERSLVKQAQKHHQRRIKKERQKQQRKGWGNFARPSSAAKASSMMAPATLTLAPKTTQQLVDDAANQVAQGMSDIGQRVMNVAAVPGQSSLAAAAGSHWMMQNDVNNSAMQQQQPQNNNSFAAFGEDDSDNEWSDTKPTKKVPSFQFQPASFSFQSSFVSLPSPIAPPAGDDVVDPDL